MQDLLDRKGSGFCRVAPAATVLQAVQLLYATRAGALAVMDGERLVGIFSERDFVRLMAQHGPGCTDLPVGEVMTAQVRTVDPDTKVMEGLTLMVDRFVRHAPVLAGETVVGMVSIRDLAFEVVARHESVLAALAVPAVGLSAPVP